MASAKTSQLNELQQQTFSQCPAAWRKLADKAVQLNVGLVRTNVLARHELGEIVRTMKGDERKYGEGAIKALSVVLGERDAYLYQVQQFALAYTRAEVEKLLESATQANFQLTWTHFEHLSSLTGTAALDKLRKSLEADVINEQLTVAELTQRIQRKKGRSQRGTRPPSMPRTPLVGLGQQRKAMLGMINRRPVWEQGVLQKLLDHPDQADEFVIEAVKEVRDLSRRVREAAEFFEQQYNVALESVLPGGAAAAAEEPEEDEGDDEEAYTDEVEEDLDEDFDEPSRRAVKKKAAKKRPAKKRPAKKQAKKAPRRRKRKLGIDAF